MELMADGTGKRRQAPPSSGAGEEINLLGQSHKSFNCLLLVRCECNCNRNQSPCTHRFARTLVSQLLYAVVGTGQSAPSDEGVEHPLLGKVTSFNRLCKYLVCKFYARYRADAAAEGCNQREGANGLPWNWRLCLDFVSLFPFRLSTVYFSQEVRKAARHRAGRVIALDCSRNRRLPCHAR